MITQAELIEARDGRRPFNDLPWLCEDADGEIAIFESAGFGQIPLEVFDRLDDYLAAIPLIHEAIADHTHYVFDYAEVGWLDRTKPYTLISEPLPVVARVDLRSCPRAKCAAFRFREIRHVLIDEHFGRTNV